MLLRALERNAADGVDGRLVSLDFDPLCGFLVRDDPALTARWTKVIGLSSDLLPEVVAGEPIGLLLQDTPHTEENQRHEFGVALRQAADPLVLIEGSGGYCPTMGQLAGAARRRAAALPRAAEGPLLAGTRPAGRGGARCGVGRLAGVAAGRRGHQQRRRVGQQRP